HQERVSLRATGKMAADRLFQIDIKDDGFGVFGDDIWMQAEIESALFQSGGKAVIETPHGPVTVRIEPGCVPGSCLTLAGLGLPATEQHPKGKLHIRLLPKAERPYAERARAFRNRWLAQHVA